MPGELDAEQEAVEEEGTAQECGAGEEQDRSGKEVALKFHCLRSMRTCSSATPEPLSGLTPRDGSAGWRAGSDVVGADEGAGHHVGDAVNLGLG